MGPKIQRKMIFQYDQMTPRGIRPQIRSDLVSSLIGSLDGFPHPLAKGGVSTIMSRRREGKKW
jgi:hypothetical protein